MNHFPYVALAWDHTGRNLARHLYACISQWGVPVVSQRALEEIGAQSAHNVSLTKDAHAASHTERAHNAQDWSTCHHSPRTQQRYALDTSKDLDATHGPSPVSHCHYPLEIPFVAHHIAKGALGILICFTGLGMSMGINRYNHCRGALCSQVFLARYARLHNDSNGLILGSSTVTADVAAQCAHTFLTTPFEGGRHAVRCQMLTEMPTATPEGPWQNLWSPHVVCAKTQVAQEKSGELIALDKSLDKALDKAPPCPSVARNKTHTFMKNTHSKTTNPFLVKDCATPDPAHSAPPNNTSSLLWRAACDEKGPIKTTKNHEKTMSCVKPKPLEKGENPCAAISERDASACVATNKKLRSDPLSAQHRANTKTHASTLRQAPCPPTAPNLQTRHKTSPALPPKEITHNKRNTAENTPEKKHAKKHLGQHFLHDQRILHTIAQQAQGASLILEIGPGYGALTTHLVALHPRHMVAVEVDKDLAQGIKEKFPHITLVHQDALTLPWESYNNYHIVGNLPYNISVPLILQYVEKVAQGKMHGCATFMVQKEVAQRMLANPGSPHYGRLSVMIQTYVHITKVLQVGPGAFWPAPKVDSWVVHLHGRNLEHTPPFGFLSAVVAQAFSQRRKMLYKNFPHWPKDHSIWTACAIEPTLRAEVLTLADFWSLASYGKKL